MADSGQWGLTINPGTDLTRIQAGCPHQSGLLYVVPAERSWVCTPEQMPGHALAGFFRELLALEDQRVAALMQQWGLYYRSLPLEGDGDGDGDGDGEPEAAAAGG